MFRRRRYWVIVLLGYSVIAFSGCATLWEGAKGVGGVSTKALEKNRKSAIAREFNYDYFSCYTKTSNILKELGAYIYSSDIKKHLIAVYVSEENTTPVGVFFEERGPQQTKVEVSSPSQYARELIAKKLFAALGPVSENK